MVARISKKPEGLRQVLDRALPQRKLAIKRESLLEAMIERIETWKALQPEAAPHAAKQTRASEIARSLQAAARRTEANLKRLGVESEIAKARAQRSADTGIPPDKVKLGGFSASVDLALITGQLLHELDAWQRMYQHGRGAPRAFGATLTEVLAHLCRERARLSKMEFDDLLAMISGTFGLPSLSTETLRKRKQRGTK